MNAIFSDDPDESVGNITEDSVASENSLSDEETAQPSSKEKLFNISARRKIEEYLEKKRLASLTADYFFND